MASSTVSKAHGGQAHNLHTMFPFHWRQQQKRQHFVLRKLIEIASWQVAAIKVKKRFLTRKTFNTQLTCLTLSKSNGIRFDKSIINRCVNFEFEL